MKQGTIGTEEGTRQHKNMAMGKSIPDQGSDFGVGSFGSGHKPHPDATRGEKPLAPQARSAPGPLSRGSGMMGATANSDHGPHYS